MLTEAKIRELFETIRRHSSADEVEIIVSGGRYALTRFANNTIHQNVAEENYVLSVRPVMAGRTARATTNKLDDESLKRVVQSAEALTRVQQPDPDLLPMCAPEEALAAAPQSGEFAVTVGTNMARHTPLVASPPSRHFEHTAALTPEDRAAAVGKIVQVAERNKLTTAGIFAASENIEAMMNSRGLTAFHRQTSSEVSITMLASDSSGWQKQNSPDVAQLDAERLAQIAAQKARDSAAPHEAAPGKYTVILEPAAVLDLVGFMFWDWGGLAVLDQRSFLNNRVGTKLFGENVTIWDDAYHALQSGPAFDGEGVRRKRLPLVENGVVRNLVYARGTAAKMKKSEHAGKVGEVVPTGHGLPLPNELGEIPLNIVFASPAAGTAKSTEQMIASTERGILVTRLWYIREVDPYEKILTGMTRDGTFLIEGGKLRHGLLNFRFNESLIHLLSNVEEMGTPVRASGEESFDMVVPAMKVRDFNFTEVTKF